MRRRKDRNSRLDMDPDKSIVTNKSPGRAKQDMEFGESMETDMNRYSRDMAGKAIDSSRKTGAGDDSGSNLTTEAGQEIRAGRDLSFGDKMYTPDEHGRDTAQWSRDLTKAGTEFGRDYELEVEKQTSPYAGGNTESASRRLRSSIPPRDGFATEFGEETDLKPGGARTNKSSKDDKKVY
jgi:hypothetical protein